MNSDNQETSEVEKCPHLKPKIRFSSQGLSTQTNFTPLMFRRAHSLRGSKNRISNILETANTNATTKDVKNANKKLKNYLSVEDISQRSSILSRSSDASADISPRYSFLDGSSDPGFIKEDSSQMKASRSSMNHVEFFMADLVSYYKDLQKLIRIYDRMKDVSPEKIRQHFDLAFVYVEKMFYIEEKIIINVQSSDKTLKKIGEEYQNNDLIIYQQYMIMSPKIMDAMKVFEAHLETNFPSLKFLIMKPATRVNKCLNFLNEFLNQALGTEIYALKKGIVSLKDIKRNADTEMTLQNIKNCPVSLRLAGRMLHVGELVYLNGPLLKRSYCLILFQDMLVFTVNKVSYFDYVTHYRVEQLISVERDIDKRLHLTVASSAHGVTQLHSFKQTLLHSTSKWYYLLEDILHESKASYELCDNLHLCKASLPITGKCIPLSLWRVYPFLSKFFTKSNKDPPTKLSLEELCNKLISEEEMYVNRLNIFFHMPDFVIPNDLEIVIKKIITLHELFLLPELRKAGKRRYSDVINTFMNLVIRLSDYQTYLVKRALYHASFEVKTIPRRLMVPIRHLSFYINWAKQLSYDESYFQSAQYAEETLLSYITNAKVSLLHEALPNCYLDFYRTGELQKVGSLYVASRLKHKIIKDSVYVVLLFEKILLITKPTPPTYKLLIDIWLDQANFGPSTNDDKSFKLDYHTGRSKSIILEFVATDSQKRTEWVQCIKKQWSQLANRIKDSIESVATVTSV